MSARREPYKRRPPDKAGGGRDAVGHFGERSQQNDNDASAEFQGRSNARNASQPAPVWPATRGADAADDLDNALRHWRALWGAQ